MADKRLIDANALHVHWGFIPCGTGIFQGKFVIAEDVDNAPTIDAVEVVRCEQCKRATKFYDSEFGEVIFCNEQHGFTDEGGFCHKGEKNAKDTNVPTKDDKEE